MRSTHRHAWLVVGCMGVAAAQGAGAQTVAEIRAVAARDAGLHLTVSLAERRLRVIRGVDTLWSAPAAVGSGHTLRYAGQRWTFATPPGIRAVVAMDSAPLWVPPDWHYVEVARAEHLRLVWLHGDTTIALRGGTRLAMYDRLVQFVDGSIYESFVAGEHIIVDNVLYVPPIGSPNRAVPGTLGPFRLALGDGIAMHGTTDSASVGHAVTHGCMRLHDADIAWLYRNVPVGTKVYIY